MESAVTVYDLLTKPLPQFRGGFREEASRALLAELSERCDFAQAISGLKAAIYKYHPHWYAGVFDLFSGKEARAESEHAHRTKCHAELGDVMDGYRSLMYAAACMRILRGEQLGPVIDDLFKLVFQAPRSDPHNFYSNGRCTDDREVDPVTNGAILATELAGMLCPYIRNRVRERLIRGDVSTERRDKLGPLLVSRQLRQLEDILCSLGWRKF